MTPIDFEISIRCHNHWLGQNFTHPHKAGVSKAHGDICVFCAEIEHVNQFIGQIEHELQVTCAQKLVQRIGVRRVQKKQCFRYYRLARQPRQRLPRKGFSRPIVVFLAWIQQRNQRSAVSDAAFWHE
jgi:hypothetical protein